MTNSEALKKMQAIKAYMTSGNPIWSVTEIGEAFDVAIEALERTEQHWIPCSERLPEEGIGVLCTTDNEYVTVLKRTKIKSRYFAFFWEDLDEEHFYYSLDEIVAWMPLPEPYKGEQI